MPRRMSSLTARARVLRPTAGVATNSWRPSDLDAPATPDGEGGPPPPVDPIAQAYALGFEEGRVDGERAEQARLASAVRAAAAALEVIESSEERWRGAVMENTIAIAVATARHLLDHAVELDPELVMGVVRRALAEFPIDQPLQVRVHPNDLAIIEAAIDHGESVELDAPERVAHWIGDTRVVPGGCLVEGRERIVDARVDTALERLYRRLTRRNA